MRDGARVTRAGSRSKRLRSQILLSRQRRAHPHRCRHRRSRRTAVVRASPPGRRRAARSAPASRRRNCSAGASDAASGAMASLASAGASYGSCATARAARVWRRTAQGRSVPPRVGVWRALRRLGQLPVLRGVPPRRWTGGCAIGLRSAHARAIRHQQREGGADHQHGSDRQRHAIGRRACRGARGPACTAPRRSVPTSSTPPAAPRAGFAPSRASRRRATAALQLVFGFACSGKSSIARLSLPSA
jgi:hypothetical protein